MIWDHAFELEYTVTLDIHEPHGPALSTVLTVTNLDDDKEGFQFTTGLHTYFKVDDIHTTRIHHLQQGDAELDFLDNLRSRHRFSESRKEISFDGELDRIYLDTSNETHIADDRNRVAIEKKSFHDTVVWNPWAEKAKAIADLGDDEWRSFVCVEAVQFDPPVSLERGDVWKASQRVYALTSE